jgi:Protein of unknown function (DUF1552)
VTFITGKHLDRRTLLRGFGGALALPLLDAMLPALAPARNALPAKRLAVVYVPNGIVMNEWTPAAAGTDFAFKRILKPLEPFREDVTMVSGMANLVALKAPGGDHGKAAGSFLSGCPPKLTSGADVHAGITFDQVVAKQFAGQTRVASLQLGCEDTRLVGNCDTGLSCAYTNCISWKNPDTPMAPDVNPRSVFEQLFGSADPSLSPETRARRALYRKSILDRTRESTEKLVSDLGAQDRRKMDEYLTAVRDVEKRISSAEKDTIVPPIDKPAGIPFQFSDYVKLMFDLQTIAFQADLTRVTTMMFGREGSVRAYPEIEVPDPHHPLTHHRGHPDFIEKVTKINCFHAELFAYFLTKLKNTKDGDGSLLDHSSILYGSALADGNSHQKTNLPLLVAGRAGGRRGGRHILNSGNEPVSNLFLALMDSVGAPAESFADSTSRLQLT